MSNALLESLSVQIEGGARLGYPEPRESLIEPPVLIRPGLYDADFVGGFSFMGSRQTELRHIGDDRSLLFDRIQHHGGRRGASL